MKIKQWIEHSEEIDIELSAEDIMLIFEEGDNQKVALMNLRYIVTFLKGLPDKCVENLTEDHRKAVSTFLRQQAIRFEI